MISPWISWRQLFPPSVSPLNPCAPTAWLLLGWAEKQKWPWLYEALLFSNINIPVLSVSSTNTNHSPIQATMMKINSVPAKPSISCNDIYGRRLLDKGVVGSKED